jgi:hypothetical protein
MNKNKDTLLREAKETAEELIDKATKQADQAWYAFFMPRNWKERKLQEARQHLEEADKLVGVVRYVEGAKSEVASTVEEEAGEIATAQNMREAAKDLMASQEAPTAAGEAFRQAAQLWEDAGRIRGAELQRRLGELRQKEAEGDWEVAREAYRQAELIGGFEDTTQVFGLLLDEIPPFSRLSVLEKAEVMERLNEYWQKKAGAQTDEMQETMIRELKAYRKKKEEVAEAMLEELKAARKKEKEEKE